MTGSEKRLEQQSVLKSAPDSEPCSSQDASGQFSGQLPGQLLGLEMERILPRKGSLRAQLDLANGWLTWSDSGQWGNNFTRTLNETDAEQIREALTGPNLFSAIREVRSGDDEPDPHLAREERWDIRIRTDRGRFRVQVADEESLEFAHLCRLVERAARTGFVR